MNKIITAGCMAVATFAAVAVPTKTELERAKPVVENMTKADLAAYKAGEKTAQKVAAAHIAYAQKAEGEAAKYLLLQGAFKLYARSGEYDLAAEAIGAMKREIKDLPPAVIAEIVGDELRYVSDDKAPRLVAMLKEAKGAKSVDAASRRVKDRTTIQSIIDGMIKVPGQDIWLSETELTQGQWESVMGNNPSQHKGVDFPVENVSRDECDEFLEKLNQTKEVLASRFEFRLPGRVEWAGAARAGSGRATKCYPFIRPGIVGNLLDMAWVKENSSNETHAVVTKAPNAWGFYDMAGNVGEQVIEKPGFGCRRGYAFNTSLKNCRPGFFGSTSRDWKRADSGLRVAAHIRPNKASTSARPQLRGSLLARRKDMKDTSQLQATVDGYTWSYRVDNGEATIEATKDGKFVCAVSQNPTGDITIPSMLNGVKVTSIGPYAFERCKGLTSITIPQHVKCVGERAFLACLKLRSVTIPSGVTNIDDWAFWCCTSLESVTMSEGVTDIGKLAFYQCRTLRSLTVPASVRTIAYHAFEDCRLLTSVTMCGERPESKNDLFCKCPALTEIHVPANAKSWAGMKEWQGKKLVFDAKTENAK